MVGIVIFHILCFGNWRQISVQNIIAAWLEQNLVLVCFFQFVLWTRELMEDNE